MSTQTSADYTKESWRPRLPGRLDHRVAAMLVSAARPAVQQCRCSAARRRGDARRSDRRTARPGCHVRPRSLRRLGAAPGLLPPAPQHRHQLHQPAGVGRQEDQQPLQSVQPAPAGDEDGHRPGGGRHRGTPPARHGLPASRCGGHAGLWAWHGGAQCGLGGSRWGSYAAAHPSRSPNSGVGIWAHTGNGIKSTESHSEQDHYTWDCSNGASGAADAKLVREGRLPTVTTLHVWFAAVSVLSQGGL